MKEIRVHGRGGQGAVLAARMLASAFVSQGKYVANFPMYGFERRGAPVVAFTRVDDKPIREKSQIYHPDYLIIIDPTLIKLPTLFQGLKENGVVLLNSSKSIKEKPDSNINILGLIDATKIALEEIGKDVPNTCLLGAFAATTGIVELKYLITIFGEYFSDNLLKANIHCVERGFHEVQVIKW